MGSPTYVLTKTSEKNMAGSRYTLQAFMSNWAIGQISGYTTGGCKNMGICVLLCIIFLGMVGIV